MRMVANNSSIHTKGYWLMMLLSASYFAAAQNADSVNKKRLNAIVIGSAAGYTATYIGLYHLWYNNAPSQHFAFFNDNAEWKQADKLGHFYSSFYCSYINSQVYRWANVSGRKADLIGALTGVAITVPIEIFDGYSARYGASAGDLIADAAGPAFFLAQKYAWNQIRIIPKFSFHRTSFASLRPELLGDNLVSEIVKDYNGQTQWLSFDMDKFIPFPKWLNFAVGYGAQGMVYARDAQNQAAGFDAYRQYYLALDFDLTAVRSKSKFVRTLIFFANAIKLPAPTLEFSRNRTSFHGFYF